MPPLKQLSEPQGYFSAQPTMFCVVPKRPPLGPKVAPMQFLSCANGSSCRPYGLRRPRTRRLEVFRLMEVSYDAGTSQVISFRLHGGCTPQVWTHWLQNVPTRVISGTDEQTNECRRTTTPTSGTTHHRVCRNDWSDCSAESKKNSAGGLAVFGRRPLDRQPIFFLQNKSGWPYNVTDKPRLSRINF